MDFIRYVTVTLSLQFFESQTMCMIVVSGNLFWNISYLYKCAICESMRSIVCGTISVTMMMPAWLLLTLTISMIRSRRIDIMFNLRC